MTFSLESQFNTRAKMNRQRRKGKRPSAQRNKFQTRRLFLEPLEERRVLAGTWTNLAASGAGPANGQMMMLLSDGSVMVQGGSNQASSTIFKLTPEANTGSYVNGVWSDIDDLNEGRLFYTTTMLPDARVFAVGGEYPKYTNTAEIYDPIADTWTYVAPVPSPPSSVFLSGAITGASNTSPITISTTSRISALVNGQQVTISGVGGNTAANGTWTIANLTSGNPNTFDLVGSAGNGAYTTGGTWASVPAAVSQFGDGVIEMLPDGQILAGQSFSTYRYNPATNTWTTLGPKLRGDSNNEETWVILPDHSILSYDIRASRLSGVFQAQRYVRATDSWVDASNLDPVNPPSVLSGNAQGSELGPGFLQPDGNVIFFGANGNTAIYNPTTNIWTAGPAEPKKNLTIDPDGSGDYDVVVPGPTPVSTFLVGTDNPGAMLPNGHILIALSPLGPTTPSGGYSFPLATYIYEYDPVAQTFTENTPPGLTAENAYQLNMVVLPSGQVLLANGQGVFQIYTPDALVPTQDSWRPVITGIANNGGGVYTMSGKQLNGISEGANYGDDYMSSTNYPIVQLEDSVGNISYARTFNWSNTGVATGDAIVTTKFSLPAGTSLADFKSIRVIANGIPSLPVSPVGLGAGQENIVVRVDPIDSNIIQVLIDGSGAVLATYPNNSATPISIVGDGNNNRVVIDETYGNVNTPIQFEGGGTTGAPGDRLLVMGSSGDDVLNLSPSSLTSASMVLNGSNPYTFSNITQFAFFGGAGNDTMSVDDGAPITSVPLFFDGDNAFAFSGDVTFNFLFGEVNFEGHGSYTGGNGFDQLILLNTSAGGPAITADKLSPGATFGSGQSTVTAGIGSQNLFFQNLEPIIDLLPSPSLNIASIPGFASLLDASNAINYVDGGSGTGRVTIDGFEPITFSNKDNLIIAAGAGSDTINLNNPTRPTGFTPGGLKTITVNGSDPTASDTLVVNGIAGVLDNLRYLPTNVGAGNVVNDSASQPNVVFTGTEHLTLVVQQADGDGVRVDGTTGNDAVEYSHGSTSSSGSFVGTMDQANATGVGPFTMTPMSYSGASPLGNDSDVNFFNPGGTDSFVFNGTAVDDTMSIQGGEAGGTEFRNTLNGIAVSRVEVFNVATTLVRGLAGNDTFNVTVPAGPAAVTIRIEGGDSDASSDTINYTSVNNAATTIDLAASTIASTGANPVSFSGIEHIVETSSGASSTLTINGNSGQDAFYISSATAGTGSLHSEIGADVDFSGVGGSITFKGNDPTASDTLVVNGLTGVLDNLRYVPTNVGAGTIINDSQPQPNVLFTGIEHLTLVVQQADGDGVRVEGTTGNDAVEYFHGSTSSSGSFVGTMDQANATGVGPFTMTPMNYTGVSPVANDSDINFFNPGGTDSLVFNGTAADDNIAVGTGEAGGSEFRNTLNGILVSRLEVFNVANTLVRALAGNDTINVTLPAGPAATTIRVEGGDSDAKTDTLNYTAASGATTTVSLATDTITQTGPAGNPVTYSGVERINLAKSGAGTTLVVVGTAGDDTIDFTPATSASGSFKAAYTGAFVGTSPQFTYTGNAAITVDGSASGFDELGIIATAGNDVFNAIQQNAAQLQVFLNALTQTFGIVSMEAARLDALAGDDLIRVSVDDSLVATPAGSLSFRVNGGPPNASDRLIVNDDGLQGDLTILRQAADQRSGSATVGTLNPVVYSNIERFDITPVNSVTGGVGLDGNGRIDVFHSDPFEYNETRLTAATLSRISENPTGPTIDPGAVVAPFAVPGDEDWYEFRPLATGTFAVKILFDLQGPLANGRQGLPGTGDLNLDIYDANGVLIVPGTLAPGGKQAIFGATNDPAFPQFNRIFVRVRGTTPESINHYEFDNLAGLLTNNPGVGNADLFGPQVTDIQVNSVPSADYNLFNSKDADNALHPTPLTNSLLISFQDLPLRAPGFVYPALDPVTATTPGTYVLKGDATGIIAISSIIIEPGTNLPPAVGGLATGQVRLVFANPLPDDRFTLTINDNLEDPAGNSLDGESNAAEPNGGPTLPSGDGEAGGDFIGRFTIDSRAEFGATSSGSVYVDTNGNYLFDPTNADLTNRDITYLMGFTSDNVFAGNFAALVNLPATLKDDRIADGFDKLAAYGKVGNNYRWLIDVNNDGVIKTADGDQNLIQPAIAGITNLSGMPVAGNFDSNAGNGDEVGLKVGNTWILDKNHDFKVETKLVGTNMVGLPIVGDFDNDGIEDLGSWADDKFYLNLSTLGAIDGTADRIFTFGFSSVRERPVAGDFDADGVTDLGLWVPDRSGVAPTEAAEWYLLLSGGKITGHGVGQGVTILDRLNAGGGTVSFTPAPFGNDRFEQFGDEFGLPVPGNFDPPITSAQPVGGYTNSRDKSDVDNDGSVSPIDALLIINRLNSGNTSLASTPFVHAPYVDVNGDGSVSPVDALMVINQLNSPSSGSGTSGEGEADAVFAELGDANGSDDSISVLLATDDYLNFRKR